jgi:Raf kinase inhibitor-like YbhB/YbcL family protein
VKKPTIWIIILAFAGALIFTFWSGDEPLTAPQNEASMQELKITSSAFTQDGMIPERFTCDGDDLSPPIDISGVPKEAKTLALIMHDPDAPHSGGWTHWVKWNMKNVESGMLNIEEGKEPEGLAGKGTGGNTAYQGPCPPSGTHRYFFSVYALDTLLSLKAGATKTELESAMEGHILAKGELMWRYARGNK